MVPIGVSSEYLKMKNTTNTEVVKSYVGPKTRVQVISPFDKEEASKAFNQRSWFSFQSFGPNDKIISTLLEYPDFHLSCPDEYEAILNSFSRSFFENPIQLLEYVEANQEKLHEMFEGKPFPFYIFSDRYSDFNNIIGWGSKLLLTEEQIKLLQLTPINTLVFRGEFNNEISPRVDQMLEVIPKMEKLTEIEAIHSRFIPRKLFNCFGKAIKFSAKLDSGYFAQLEKLPNIMKLKICFECGGKYEESSRVLLKTKKLEKLTLNGDSTSSYAYTGCLKNIPDGCKKLRLHRAKFSVEEIFNCFKHRPLNILYLRNCGYSEGEICRLIDKGITSKIVIETGGY